MSERNPSIEELDQLADESQDTTDSTGSEDTTETKASDATEESSQPNRKTTTDRNPTIGELDELANDTQSRDAQADTADTTERDAPINPAPQQGPNDVGLQDPEGEQADPVLEQTEGTADVSQATERRSGFDEQQQQSQPSDALIQEAAQKTEFSEQEVRDIVSDDTTSVDDISNTAFVDQSDIGNDTGAGSTQQTERAAPGQNTAQIQATEDIAQDLTSGGLLGEQREQQLRGLSQKYQQGLKVVSNEVGRGVRVSQEAVTGTDIEGESQLEKFAEGTTTGIGSIGDVPGLVLTGEQVAEFTGGTLANVPNNPGQTAETAAVVGGSAGAQIAGQFIQQGRENPAGTAGIVAGGTVGSLGTGAVVGKGLYRVGRGGRDRIRGAGGEEIDAEELASKEVVEGDKQFPGADKPEQVKQDPATAITEQANRNTPEAIQRQFDEAGVEGDADLKKALDVEPEGPESRRAAQGLEAPEADSDLAGQFETAGSSLGPEVSPNFLRIDAGESPDMSLRPGIPDLGNSPTAVVVRTDVENPRARSTEAFDEELREREGDTTALAVRDEFEGFSATEEAEAQIPPGSEFVDVGTGPVRNTLRRVGVGSDFTTEINGRTVPVRTVAPESEVSGGSRTVRDLFDDERGQVGGTSGGPNRVVRDIRSRRGSTPDTTPSVPVPPSGGSEADPVSGGSGSAGGSDDTGSRPPSGGSGGGSGFGGGGGSDPPDGTSPPGGSGGGGSDGGSGGSGGGGGSPPGDRPPGGGGSDTGGTSGGSGLSPQTPSNTGKSPILGPQGSGNRPRFPDTESDEDQDEFIPVLGRAQNPVGADFVNPLTGDVLETDLNVGDVDLED